MNTKRFLMLVPAVLTLGCTSLRASHPPVLKTQTHTAADAGFAVNSHLITGEKEAVLVDSQFTRSEAKRVVKLVRQSGKKLTTIYITHAHPDHYFGLETLKAAFPEARVIASRETIAGIAQTASGKLEYWRKSYGPEMPDRIVLPEAFNGSSLELEGAEIRIVELGEGESEHANALYLPSSATLLTGDLAYHGVHLWLAEDRPEGWLKNLAAVKKLGAIKDVRPGHGVAGDASVLDSNREYIDSFVKITAQPVKKAEALAKLKARYPKYRLPVIAELSVGARAKE